MANIVAGFLNQKYEPQNQIIDNETNEFDYGQEQPQKQADDLLW